MKINTSKEDLKDTGLIVSQRFFKLIEMGFPNKKRRTEIY